jgi:hypothetical protein
LTLGKKPSLELIIAIIEGLLWLLDITFAAADVYAWFRGRENRIERREARRAGQEVPPRDKWNEQVVVFTVSFCILSLILLTWLLASRT